jgi:hypothetical protein
MIRGRFERNIMPKGIGYPKGMPKKKKAKKKKKK